MSTVAALPVAKADPVARARALGPALAAAADEIERTQEIPEPLLSQLHEARLFRMLLPRSVGGDQVEPWIYLRAIEEIARFDGSVGWNSFVGNSSALIAPYIPIEAARTIYSDPRGLIAWGPPNQHRAIAAPGGYRVTGEWHFASGSRQANWMGAHCHVVEPDGSLRLNRFGRPTVRTLLMPKDKSTPIRDWNTLGMRGTASEGYSINDVFVPEEFSGTREDPTLAARPRAALRLHHPEPLCRRRRRRGARHRPRHARGLHGAHRRQDAALHGAAGRQSGGAVDGGAARGSARLGARLPGRHPEGLLGQRRRHRAARLGRPRARAAGLQPGDPFSLEVADAVYKAAGTSAIFLGTPFERRFRDIHTLSQQIQSREAHFETVGKVMLNGDPDSSFLG